MKHFTITAALATPLLCLIASCSSSGSGSPASTATASDSVAAALVDSLTTDTLNFDSLTAEQCGIRIAELEVQALLTAQQVGENSVAAMRAVSTVNKAILKVVERFNADSIAQNAFNTSYDMRYTQLVAQYPQVKSYSSSISASSTPAQLGIMGAEMEIMAQLAALENGENSPEHMKAVTDMEEFQKEIIKMFQDNPDAQNAYLNAYAAHYQQMADQLAANAAIVATPSQQ